MRTQMVFGVLSVVAALAVPANAVEAVPDPGTQKKWAGYQQAASDMFERTSTPYAPWTLVEANDKYFARVKILKTLCERVEQALKG